MGLDRAAGLLPYDNVCEDEYLDSRLKQLGLAPGDIDFVVFSHLHFDHAGSCVGPDPAIKRSLCDLAPRSRAWASGRGQRSVSRLPLTASASTFIACI